MMTNCAFTSTLTHRRGVGQRTAICATRRSPDVATGTAFATFDKAALTVAFFRLCDSTDDYLSIVSDIPEPVSWTVRHRVWWLPYILWPVLSVTVAWFFGAWYVGLAFAVGLMSHPVQGWMINSFGHAYGPRNFDIADNSRNNYPVAIATFGEGLQNNHHYAPASARFRYRWFEPDLGFLFCRALDSVRFLTIRRDTLIPTRRQERRRSPGPAESAVAQP